MTCPAKLQQYNFYPEPVMYHNNCYNDKSCHHNYTNSSIFVNTKFKSKQESVVLYCYGY